ncbi:MAG: flagellar basal body L-ring protein FlgH [Pirellulales bacterium]
MTIRILIAAATLGLAGTAVAQESSLYQRGPNGVMLQTGSLIYSEAMRPRELKLNDLVTIRVNEAARFNADGELDRRATTNLDARLQNWLEFDGMSLGPSSSTGTDLPRARGNYNLQSRMEGGITESEALTFNITARVVDIRPNGLLVLEARKALRVNEEIIENSLTGIVRREDIKPDNVVLSDKIAELSINRRTVGQVRDAYKRGWLTRFWDGVNPF